jgi:hypothetical protein
MRCLLVLTLFFSTKLKATIGFEDGIFPELATSGRALAMGNAFICKVDDASATFYNPAGLGSVRFAHIHLSNFNFETNKDVMRSATAGTFSNAMSNIGNIASIDGFRKLLSGSTGNIAHSRIALLPNFTARYFSFGFLYAKRMRATITNTSATGFEYADRTDMGPSAAINLSLFGGVFKLGASGVLLNRQEAIGTSDPAQTISLGKAAYKKGTTSFITFGTKLTLPIEFLPTFAANMHNAMGKSFSADSGYSAPPSIAKSMDVGFSITPQIGKEVRVHLEANYKDLTGQVTGVSMARRLLFGMEVDFYRTYFLRAGYGDGFGSGGIGIRSKNLEFDLTTYAVDTTASSFRGREDRRFVLGLSSGF